MCLKNIPIGLDVHNIELIPGRSGQIARSAGHRLPPDGPRGRLRRVVMPSGEMRRVRVPRHHRRHRQRQPHARVDRQGRRHGSPPEGPRYRQNPSPTRWVVARSQRRRSSPPARPPACSRGGKTQAPIRRPTSSSSAVGRSGSKGDLRHEPFSKKGPSSTRSSSARPSRWKRAEKEPMKTWCAPARSCPFVGRTYMVHNGKDT
ncbi:MAG: hypothetical protein R3F20_09750 [Planctomycetota bacterium]